MIHFGRDTYTYVRISFQCLRTRPQNGDFVDKRKNSERDNAEHKINFIFKKFPVLTMKGFSIINAIYFHTRT